MNKQTRTYEEIITLQDKAIEALTQANAALVMALEALKKARAEHGFTVQLPGLGQQIGGVGGGYVKPIYVQPSYVPNTTDGIQWGQTTGLMTVTNTVSSAGLAAKTATITSLIAQSNSQKELAQAYISGFQAWQAKKEHDGGEVGGCISVSQIGNE